MADTLNHTFRETMLLTHNYALVPKGTPIPIARNDEGQPGCQYEFNFVTEIGLITLNFEP